MKEATELMLSIKRLFDEPGRIPLHIPHTDQNDREYVLATLEKNMISTAGPETHAFEKELAEYIDAEYVIALNTGTSALHLSLIGCGANQDTIVLTQAISFVATTNAVIYCGAEPVFIDVAENSLSICPIKLTSWLQKNAKLNSSGLPVRRFDGKKISAVLLVHVFGRPADIKSLSQVCREWNISLVEDAAEALGSTVGEKMCGTFGRFGAFSFNGNKIISTGAGGAIVCKSDEDYQEVLSFASVGKITLSGTASHDRVGYNYRMPSLNAALGRGQLSKIRSLILAKQKIQSYYKNIFDNLGVCYLSDSGENVSNNWLVAIVCQSKYELAQYIEKAKDFDIEVRPIWPMINKLPMFTKFNGEILPNSEFYYERVLTLPSFVPRKWNLDA